MVSHLLQRDGLLWDYEFRLRATVITAYIEDII